MASLEQLDNTVAHLNFISYKGFDVKSVNSLRNGLKPLMQMNYYMENQLEIRLIY